MNFSGKIHYTFILQNLEDYKTKILNGYFQRFDDF